MGQKGRNAHVWYEKGVRPAATTDRRFKSAYIYGAVLPGTDDAFALVLPRADTAMMTLLLSDRVFQNTPAIVDGCARAWNDLKAETGRIASQTDCPYLRQVRTL